MAIATFAELIASPNVQRDFLLTVEPKERLRNWAKTGGYTYTYEKAWASWYADGFCSTYRQLTGIEQNGAPLTSRVSIALVDADAGSYFFDEANGKIYIHLTDDGTADRGTIWIVVFFKLFFSSGLGASAKGKIFSNIFYEPLFAASNLPAIVAEQTELLAGGAISTGDATFTLANHARFFDKCWTAWSWKNAAIEVRMGGEELPYSEYFLIYAGTVRQETWQANQVQFDTTNQLEILKRNVPVNPCFGDTVKDDDKGKPLPLLFGTVDDIIPLCTKATPIDATEWTIADPAFQTLQAVAAVYDGGALVAPAKYSVDLANCKITFSSYTPAGEITVSASGAKTGDIPGESSTDLMTNASDIVRFFLKRILGLSDAELDTASFAEAKAALADLPLAKYVRFRRNLASYLAEIERSTLSVIFQDPAGKIGYAAFDPFFTADETITNEEIRTFKQSSPADKLYAGVKVYYNATPHERPESGGVEGEDDTYDVAVGDNTNSRYLDGETTAYRRVITWLRGKTAGETIRDRLLYLTNKSIQEYDVEINGGKLFLARPGQVLEVSKANAPTPSGTLFGQLLQILSITKQLAQNKATLKLDNFAGTAYLVGQWCADAAPAWASATEQQRLEQGFWCDSDGLVVSGDWTTAEKSAWW